MGKVSQLCLEQYFANVKHSQRYIQIVKVVCLKNHQLCYNNTNQIE